MTDEPKHTTQLWWVPNDEEAQDTGAMCAMNVSEAEKQHTLVAMPRDIEAVRMAGARSVANLEV